MMLVIVMFLVTWYTRVICSCCVDMPIEIRESVAGDSTDPFLYQLILGLGIPVAWHENMTVVFSSATVVTWSDIV